MPIWRHYRWVAVAQGPCFVWASIAGALQLCCLFRDQPIKFVTTTATSVGKMKRPDAVAITSELARRCDQHNAVSMVNQEVQATQSLALKRELAIKRLSRQQKELRIQDNHSSTISSICSSSSVS